MPHSCQCSGVVSEGFEEVGLALGGAVAIYDLPDEAVCDLSRAIDLAHKRVQAKLSKSNFISELEDVPQEHSRHPAIEYLLRRLVTDRTESRGHCE